MLVIAFLVLTFGASCTNELSGQNPDQQPILGIIGIFFAGTGAVIINQVAFDSIDGNSVDEGVVQVEVPGEFPDGSTVEFTITASSSAFGQSVGCLIATDPFIVDGQAFAVIGGALNTEGFNVLANIAAEITTPDGFSNSDFLTYAVTPVSLTSTGTRTLEVPFCPGDPGVFIVLTFNATNVPNGTEIEFTVSDPFLGDVFPMMGTVENETITIGYFGFNEVGGLQTVTATLVLENPLDVGCGDVPEGARTLSFTVFITQSVGDEPAMGCM